MVGAFISGAVYSGAGMGEWYSSSEVGAVHDSVPGTVSRGGGPGSGPVTGVVGMCDTECKIVPIRGIGSRT
ncbi:MAG: hypothetical protein B5766_07700 [Candidatus Lumbricidophila eiseniae]|uniref:Uncharacterized protein n=1 Tax=Candidatus Lumbricidiphila eiseniae TaxID=1969409 RepID=A0A2A6FQN9_9MICO|nr:MAG: hypothetical protein B5766_07700 [Candidatus Lumbricidophila eiseniae]